MCGPIQKRHAVCFLSFLGVTIIHSMRVSLAITMVTILDNEPHNKVGSQDARELPDVDWSPTLVGLLHAMFTIGYVITMVPGGYLATKIPSNRIFGNCIGLSCALNLLLPFAIADLGFVLTCSLRFLQGLLEGAVIPCLYKIIHDWAPRSERSSFTAFCLAGMYVGAIIGYPLDGLVTHYANWQYMYYIHSAAGLIWYGFWFLFVYETPEFDSSVTKEEKLLIAAGRHRPHTGAIPWRSVFTSGPVWAVIACHFVRSWMLFFLLTYEPAYLNIFNFSILENGIFSATPHVLKVACCILGGFIADRIIAQSPCSLTAVRKCFTCIGFGVEAICCYALSGIRSGYAAIVVLNIGVGAGGATVAGWQVNFLDLAPEFASLLVGISASIGTLGGILSPLIIGAITHPQTLWNWQKSFIITGSVLTVGIIIYAVLGSGELQPWAIKPNATGTDDMGDTDAHGVQPDEKQSLHDSQAALPNYKSSEPVDRDSSVNSESSHH